MIKLKYKIFCIFSVLIIPLSISLFIVYIFHDLRTKSKFSLISKHLRKELELIFTRGEFSNFFTNKILKELSNPSSASSSNIAEMCENFIKQFPKGAIKIFWFDQTGTLTFPKTDDKIKSALEKCIKFLKTPWWKKANKDLKFLNDLETLLPNPKDNIEILRYNSRVLHKLVQGKKINKELPTHAFFGNYPNRFSALIFLNQYLIHNDLPWTDILSKYSSKKFSFGFKSPRSQMIPSGISSNEDFDAIIKKHAFEPNNGFIFKNVLVEIKATDDDVLLIGIYDLKSELLSIDWPVLSCYVTVLVLFATFFVGFYNPTKYLKMSLSKKLLIFFILGIVFPMAVSCSLAVLYLLEKREEILDKNLKKAFKELELLDEQFDDFRTALELFYKDKCGEFGKKPLPPEKMADLLFKVKENFGIISFFIIASDTSVISSYFCPQDIETMELTKLPLKVRLKTIDTLLKRGWWLPHEDLEILVTREMIASMPQRKISEVQLGILKKSLVFGALESFRYVDSLHGFTPKTPQKTSEVTIAGLAGDKFQEMILAFRRSYLGKLELFQTLSGQGFYFTNVVRGKDGRSWYLVFINHSYEKMQAEYLRRFFKKRQLNTNNRIKTIGFLRPLDPSFPVNKDFQTLNQTVKNLLRTDTKTTSFETTYNGIDVQVAAKAGVNLKNYYLFNFIPVQNFIETISIHINPVIRSFGVAFCFCIFLALLLALKLLVPVNSIASGVNALKTKDFNFQLPIFAKDELGTLCKEINKTIALMNDMEIASAIQQTLLPQKRLLVGEFELLGKNKMTQAIGGDYFDFLKLTDSKIGIIIGDVSGHGFSAAIVTAMAKAGFSILAKNTLNPAEVLSRLSYFLLNILNKKKMMTCLFGILDIKTQIFRIAVSGQSPPIVIPRNNKAHFLEIISFPLGISKRLTLSEKELDLSQSAVVFYTDGLVEATNEKNQPLGYEAFLSIVEKNINCPSENILENIFHDVKTFTGNVPWADDATIVLLRNINFRHNLIQ